MSSVLSRGRDQVVPREDSGAPHPASNEDYASDEEDMIDPLMAIADAVSLVTGPADVSKDKQRMKERERRKDMKDSMERLKVVVPSLKEATVTRTVLLQKTIDYIGRLQNQLRVKSSHKRKNNRTAVLNDLMRENLALKRELAALQAVAVHPLYSGHLSVIPPMFSAMSAGAPAGVKQASAVPSQREESSRVPAYGDDTSSASSPVVAAPADAPRVRSPPHVETASISTVNTGTDIASALAENFAAHQKAMLAAAFQQQLLLRQAAALEQFQPNPLSMSFPLPSPRIFAPAPAAPFSSFMGYQMAGAAPSQVAGAPYVAKRAREVDVSDVDRASKRQRLD